MVSTFWFKISMAEGTYNGYGSEDGTVFSVGLLKKGADGINVSSGTIYSGAMNSPVFSECRQGRIEAPFAGYAAEFKNTHLTDRQYPYRGAQKPACDG